MRHIKFNFLVKISSVFLILLLFVPLIVSSVNNNHIVLNNEVNRNKIENNNSQVAENPLVTLSQKIGVNSGIFQAKNNVYYLTNDTQVYTSTNGFNFSLLTTNSDGASLGKIYQSPSGTVYFAGVTGGLYYLSENNKILKVSGYKDTNKILNIYFENGFILIDLSLGPIDNRFYYSSNSTTWKYVSFNNKIIKCTLKNILVWNNTFYIFGLFKIYMLDTVTNKILIPTGIDLKSPSNFSNAFVINNKLYVFIRNTSDEFLSGTCYLALSTSRYDFNLLKVSFSGFPNAVIYQMKEANNEIYFAIKNGNITYVYSYHNNEVSRLGDPIGGSQVVNIIVTPSGNVVLTCYNDFYQDHFPILYLFQNTWHTSDIPGKIGITGWVMNYFIDQNNTVYIVVNNSPEYQYWSVYKSSNDFKTFFQIISFYTPDEKKIPIPIFIQTKTRDQNIYFGGMMWDPKTRTFPHKFYCISETINFLDLQKKYNQRKFINSTLTYVYDVKKNEKIFINPILNAGFNISYKLNSKQITSETMLDPNFGTGSSKGKNLINITLESASNQVENIKFIVWLKLSSPKPSPISKQNNLWYLFCLLLIPIAAAMVWLGTRYYKKRTKSRYKDKVNLKNSVSHKFRF